MDPVVALTRALDESTPFATTTRLRTTKPTNASQLYVCTNGPCGEDPYAPANGLPPQPEANNAVVLDCGDEQTTHLSDGMLTYRFCAMRKPYGTKNNHAGAYFETAHTPPETLADMTRSGYEWIWTDSIQEARAFID